MHRKIAPVVVALFLSIHSGFAAAWTTKESANEGGGQKIEVALDGKPVARFIFGEGQIKPYLHLYGQNGELLTEWRPNQQFPHHRGIFIGWNKIQFEIGSSDLWHLPRGEKMIVKSIRHAGGESDATIVANIEWHAQKGDDIGDTDLIKETRRLVISQPESGKTQVDARFILVASRDLTLDGDLQHAGVHFRGSHELTKREKETKYVWEPDLPGPGGKVVSADLKWARLIYPIGTNWYAVTQLNAPANPVEELSWRAYGRFGFFFKHRLEWGDSIELNYRFISEPVPAEQTEDLAAHRAAAARQYRAYTRPAYETRSRHDRDGIGKFFMGREIAHVMGHQAADWLERPERIEEEKPGRMVELLDLKPGAVVADIGAGTGYITRLLADKVTTAGTVYAVDIQPEMLDYLKRRLTGKHPEIIVPTLGTITSANLPANSIDLALMVDVYHEFSHPIEMLESIFAALKPGGRLAFVEYRAEDPSVPIKQLHKMSEAQVKREAAAVGLIWDKTFSELPWQHLIVMRKP